MKPLLVAFVVLLASACDKQQPPPAAQEPAPAPASTAASAPDEPSLKPVGEPCSTAADCADGICEGEGCDDDHLGTCADPSRMCTRDLQQYCGCDGEGFSGSGSCPGRRYATRGVCEPAS